MNKYLKNISLIGKFSQTMEYIPTEDFPNFGNISLPANKMLWLSTKCEYFPTSSTKWDYFPTNSRKSEDFPKILGVVDMKAEELSLNMQFSNFAFSSQFLMDKLPKNQLLFFEFCRNFAPMGIPHICHFFYTGKNFGQNILHRRTH